MLSHAAFSGRAEAGVYSQAIALGNFFIVLSISGPPEEVTAELGRNVIGKIEEQISLSPDITPAEIGEMQNEQFKNGIKLNIFAARISGQKLTAAFVGAVTAKLRRKDTIINLVPESPAAELRNVSGGLQHGDVLVVGTAAFFQNLKSEEIFGQPDLNATELRDQLLPKIESLDSDSHLAAVFAKIDLVGEKEEEVVLEEEKPSSNLLAEGKSLFLARKTIEGWKGGNYRKLGYLTLIALVTLISVLAYQLRSRSLEVRSDSLQKIEQEAREGQDSAQKLLGLNDAIARETLEQTKKDVQESIESDFGANWQEKNFAEKKKLVAILAMLDEEINKAAHIYEVSPADFSDFSLLKSGVKVVSAQLHDGKMVVLDGANGAIYTLVTGSKTAEIAGGDFRDGKFLDFSGEKIFVQTPNGIYQQKTGGNKQVVPSSDNWKNVSGLVFFGGNLYLLDPGSNQIWKYQGTETGFAGISNYVKEGSSLDLSAAIRMQIDGYVYVLTQSNQLVRLASGGPTDFQVTGLPDGLGKVTSIFVTDETENIYLWDEEKKRIMVADKKGLYKAQYEIINRQSSISNPILLADERVKKIFLLSGAKVFSVDIKE
ncbi:hypothetical protein A2721_03135 [Candidatus Gottesmanbacteria bacterium RIFCSPHIGHO2_01_FULL_47_48]|uniref:Uncharacterized protein n=1 Tax=Candidatus Gottesmanbacteria bacterium RIFCSPHIGHO2_01_FULL_47_48 TaxID=1798381 RepID=A0A1F5ZYZ1_9BACT|nr:MAG: hypothetical protein A2721_03135 [Candidatus Gottesmanbacteria bacterium RIFCSPHIGHO2_01_FULL_47_48]